MFGCCRRATASASAESGPVLRAGGRREDHLEGHQAFEPDLAGLVDDAHAAAAQFAENFIARHGGPILRGSGRSDRRGVSRGPGAGCSGGDGMGRKCDIDRGHRRDSGGTTGDDAPQWGQRHSLPAHPGRAVSRLPQPTQGKTIMASSDRRDSAAGSFSSILTRRRYTCRRKAA